MNKFREPGKNSLWYMLFLLIAVVIIPTVCLLWFMNRAMENDKYAVQKKLEEAYEDHLINARKKLDEYSRKEYFWCVPTDPEMSAGEVFAFLVEKKYCESAIIYDASGQIVYPVTAQPVPMEIAFSILWKRANELEFIEKSYEDAISLYERISLESENINIIAQSLLAKGRCYVKLDQKEDAAKVFVNELNKPEYYNARDPQGRMILPFVYLYAPKTGVLSKDDKEQFKELLEERISNYNDPLMPSSQRRFLLDTLKMDSPACFARLAEEYAAKYLDGDEPMASSEYLSETSIPGIWQLSTPDKRIIMLFFVGRIKNKIENMFKSELSMSGTAIRIIQPGQDAQKAFKTIPAGSFFQDWNLALYLDGKNTFETARKKQYLVYLWISVLVIGSIIILAFLIARFIIRQIKLTKLKNDFIANVSHELKTPLSSMRVLTDTLMDGHYTDEKQMKDYLALISNENIRLSRLIDNFLTFSRMERNKQVFDRNEINIDDVINDAVSSVKERFELSGCKFEVDISPDLPVIMGDKDGLITMVLNLLDNAFKYSGDEKKITLRAYEEDKNVCIEVEDNGIGISKRSLKKIFNRFYQVDKSLSSETGGCGLGLGIVNYIIKAHEGKIEVSSRINKGSKFTIKLPGVS